MDRFLVGFDDLDLNDFESAVRAERHRQNAKWGVQRHSWVEWMSVLGEEVGEACQAANRLHWSSDWVYDTDRLREFRAELVQIAAVCAAIIEHIDDRLAE